MIEALTLIGGLLIGFVGGFLTEYYRKHSYYTYEWNGWKIHAFCGIMTNKFYLWARNSEHDASIVLGPNDTLDIDYHRVKQ